MFRFIALVFVLSVGCNNNLDKNKSSPTPEINPSPQSPENSSPSDHSGGSNEILAPIFLFEENFEFSEKDGVKYFILKNQIKIERFDGLFGIFVDSEQVNKLKFNQRDIYIQPSNDQKELLTPFVQVDRDFTSLEKKSDLVNEIRFEGSKIIKLINVMKELWLPDDERFMLRILLTDASLQGDPIQAIVLIPIVCEPIEIKLEEHLSGVDNEGSKVISTRSSLNRNILPYVHTLNIEDLDLASTDFNAIEIFLSSQPGNTIATQVTTHRKDFDKVANKIKIDGKKIAEDIKVLSEKGASKFELIIYLLEETSGSKTREKAKIIVPVRL